MIRLVIVDDQVLIRQGLSSLLQARPDFCVVGEAEDGQGAIALIASLMGTPNQPDLVLLDIRMPVMDGVAAIQHIHQRWINLKVLILSTFDDDEYVAQAMQYGAKGYLLKDTPSEELAEAIRATHKGYTYLGPGLFEKAMTASPETANIPNIPPEFFTLSPREQEVLQLIATGANNREIAEALHISARTVKNHVSSILSHLQLRDRTQVALLASRFLPNLE
ncbi:MAG: response regulator transcription factor [Cyanobacteria bacterium P01_A01_bin.123]